MPVIRATKDKDFTVVVIHHLRDTRLLLKAIGLTTVTKDENKILNNKEHWRKSQFANGLPFLR